MDIEVQGWSRVSATAWDLRCLHTVMPARAAGLPSRLHTQSATAQVTLVHRLGHSACCGLLSPHGTRVHSLALCSSACAWLGGMQHPCKVSRAKCGNAWCAAAATA